MARSIKFIFLFTSLIAVISCKSYKPGTNGEGSSIVKVSGQTHLGEVNQDTPQNIFAIIPYLFSSAFNQLAITCRNITPAEFLQVRSIFYTKPSDQEERNLLNEKGRQVEIAKIGSPLPFLGEEFDCKKVAPALSNSSFEIQNYLNYIYSEKERYKGQANGIKSFINNALSKTDPENPSQVSESECLVYQQSPAETNPVCIMRRLTAADSSTDVIKEQVADYNDEIEMATIYEIIFWELIRNERLKGKSGEIIINNYGSVLARVNLNTEVDTGKLRFLLVDEDFIQRMSQLVDVRIKI